jgi:60 kDa SS-A/Ro ribonucleoprotein
MARVNVAPKNTNTTHEGGPALPNGSAQRELRRAVASCMLWENNFYETGEEIGTRIQALVAKCPLRFVPLRRVPR